MNNKEAEMIETGIPRLDRIRKTARIIKTNIKKPFIEVAALIEEEYATQIDALYPEPQISPYALPSPTDEEIMAAFDGDFGEVNFDHPPTPDDILLIKLKLTLKAHLARCKPIIWNEAHAVGFRDGVIEDSKKYLGYKSPKEVKELVAREREKFKEWLEAQRVSGFTVIEGIGVGIPISEEKWQAKLKEWGLKGGSNVIK